MTAGVVVKVQAGSGTFTCTGRRQGLALSLYLAQTQ